MAEPQVNPPAKPKPPVVTIAILAACAVCAPLTAGFEGFVPKAKPDPVGIQTGCFGERVDQSDLDPSRIYTRSECTDRLRVRLAYDYAPIIARCLPILTLPERRNEFAAMIDASYNGGPAAVCSSPMAKLIKVNQWSSAQLAYKSFRVGSVTRKPARGAMEVRRITSGPKKGWYFNKFRGLVSRRAQFAKLWATPE